MASYASGSITIPGLSGSDTDFEGMIEQLYEVESLQAQQLLRWRKDWELRKEAFIDLRTELVTLQSALKKLDSPGKMLTKAYVSSNPSIATATVSADSPVRNYSLDVQQLATAGMVTHQTNIASIKDPFGTGAGSLQIKIAGSSDVINVDMTSQTTLEGLIQMINGHPNNKGVTASYINTGSGYALQIHSSVTGSASNVEVTASGSTPFINGDWHLSADPAIEVLAGKDALFTMDGSATVITSSSNIVKNVVPGITFNFFSEGKTVINVTMDTEKIKNNLQTFVDSVNAVRLKLAELTAVNPNKDTGNIDYVDSQFDAQKGSILTGNYGIQFISSQLKGIISSTAPGFLPITSTSSGDIFNSLSQIGIISNTNEGSDNYGMLEINTVHSDDSPYGALSIDEALDMNIEAVALLLSASMNGVARNTSAFGFCSFLDGQTQAGTYKVSYAVDGSGGITGTINGYHASFDSTTNQFTSLDGPSKGLVITIYDFSAGIHDEGSVSIQNGVVNELLRAIQGDGSQNNSGILDTNYGRLSILENEYTTIIKNINKKIIKEDERLVIWERRMRARFARLEATLAEYNSINEGLKSQIESLSTKN